jgi:superfamily II DNA helicase RecQ
MALFMLEQRLLNMSRHGIILYRLENQDIRYQMRMRSLSEGTIKSIEQNVMTRRNFKMKRLNLMTGYGAHSGCLRQYLLSALADPTQKGSCSFCDNC